MKLSEFITMTDAEKNQAVLHQGILLAKQKDVQEIRFLFQLEHFYVELCCNYASKKVSNYAAFTDTRFLQPYLDQISLNGLLE